MSHSSKGGWGECVTGSGGSGDMSQTSEQGRRRVNMTRLIFILEATLALFVLLVVLSFFLVERAGQDKGGQLEVRNRLTHTQRRTRNGTNCGSTCWQQCPLSARV